MDEPAWMIGLVLFTTFVVFALWGWEICLFGLDYVRRVLYISISPLDIRWRVCGERNGNSSLLRPFPKHLVWFSSKVQLIDHAVRHQLPRLHYCPAPARAVQRALYWTLSAKKYLHTGPTN
jgi:hypothetical protein